MNDLMNKKSFYYDLPPELIAQTPIEPRDHSRLLHLGRESGEVHHRHFYDVIDLLNEGDVLVVNNSKVIPARLYGEKEGTGGLCEFLLLNQREEDVWECMVRPGRRLQPGTVCVFGGGLLKGEILQTLEGGNRLVRFYHEGTSIFPVLDMIGEMPLPHYITEKLGDNTRYQTVYADLPGSAAAPTAGLHFTPELLQKIQDKGVQVVNITLHVGLGTFRPVQEENILDHVMHTERYSVSTEAANAINDAKNNKKRVIGVGTTSCRTLEAIASEHGKVVACTGETDIFIYPGYEFKVLDGLITNFHLPESTLVMLVSAFAGYENTMSAYKQAIEEKYRFFSFGDAMVII